jgi:uncharacterized protein (DUF1330 family)
MPAYVIANMHVQDRDSYREGYSAYVPDTVAAHGGRFLARGGETQELEGDWDPDRVVIIEFPDMDAARGWYESPEYKAIVGVRQAAATGDLIFVDGV